MVDTAPFDWQPENSLGFRLDDYALTLYPKFRYMFDQRFRGKIEGWYAIGASWLVSIVGLVVYRICMLTILWLACARTMKASL
ncbi:transcriptional regulator, LuxR family [Steroidobacter denitrificans]|uniref:Transcriptional regulator, LuxR family n=1 Tax=Steroidobacter denitrificans TaxID=465721 RepID=A0A127FD76_STEDE|nr:transcriptional regulator, LuxR family [Steroidobacter denitrificans]